MHIILSKLTNLSTYSNYQINCIIHNLYCSFFKLISSNWLNLWRPLESRFWAIFKGTYSTIFVTSLLLNGTNSLRKAFAPSLSVAPPPPHTHTTTHTPNPNTHTHIDELMRTAKMMIMTELLPLKMFSFEQEFRQRLCSA